jgi:hypothetical protein
MHCSDEHRARGARPSKLFLGNPGLQISKSAECMYGPVRPRLVPAPFTPFPRFPDQCCLNNPPSLCRPRGYRRPLATARFLPVLRLTTPNNPTYDSRLLIAYLFSLADASPGATASTTPSTSLTHRDRAWHLVLRHSICRRAAVLLSRYAGRNTTPGVARRPILVARRFATPHRRP